MTEFEHIELPAKLLDYFLRSNKSNINQINIDMAYTHWHVSFVVKSPVHESFHVIG